MLPESIDLAAALPYAIPLTTTFRGITVREGMLVEGPAGWGEFCPFTEYDDPTAATWLATAVEAATIGWPAPVRDRIPVNCTVPAVSPERAHEIVTASGCGTAKVKVADHPGSLAEDLARLEAVRAALGRGGAVRCDANARWDVATAIAVIRPAGPGGGRAGIRRAAVPDHRRPGLGAAGRWTSGSPRTSPSGRPRTRCGWPSRERPTSR